MSPIVVAAIAGAALFVVSAIIHNVVRSAGDNPARDGIGWALLVVGVSSVVGIATNYAMIAALNAGLVPPLLPVRLLTLALVVCLPFLSLAAGLRLVYHLPHGQCFMFGFGILLGMVALGGMFSLVGSAVLGLAMSNPVGAAGVVGAIIAVVAVSVVIQRRSAAHFATLADSDGD